MSGGEILAIALAGLAAGTVNTVVGSGTLITFPVLLAFGYAPVTTNVSNTIGLVPGSLSGTVGYRRELAGQRRRALRLGFAGMLGGVTGAVLLLVLPASAFKAIVPLFIAIALPSTGIYGGYFGAAQGIMLLAVLGVALPQDLHRTNALKNVLATLVNGVAGVCFIFAAHVAWAPAAIIAASSVVGGQLGARYGRRLSPDALRILIVIVGTTAIVRLVVG